MTPPPALLLRAARLAGRADPVDLRLDGGRVTQIAPDLPRGPGIAEIPLEGRWVVPGVWDTHIHSLQHALVRRRLDVSQAPSAAAAAGLVAERAASEARLAGGDEVLVGFGFRDATWPDAPTRELLDAAAPGRAVVLVSGDLHCGWFSTAALGWFGLHADESGLVREEAFLSIAGTLDGGTQDQRDGWVREATRDAAARGVVGVVDLEAQHPRTWSRIARGALGPDVGTPGGERLDGDRIALRVRSGVWPQDLEDVLGLRWRTGDGLPDSPLDACGEPLLRMGPLKVITDGSLNTRTAYCHDPYPEGGHGVLPYGPQALQDLMRRAHAGGLASAIHAIGDHANQLALDAFEAVGARGSVEHAQLLSWADVPRFAALGVTASVQPAHLLDDRDVIGGLWGGREERCFPLAALVEAGVRLQLGSDAPVAPLDPWLAIAAAVRRTGDEREPWHPEQRIDARTALAASTDGHGTQPALGSVADLAILESDPLEAHPRPGVAGTLLAGEWTHRAL